MVATQLSWMTVCDCPVQFSVLLRYLRGFLINVMGKILTLKMDSYLSDSSADFYCFSRTLEREQFSHFISPLHGCWMSIECCRK